VDEPDPTWHLDNPLDKGDALVSSGEFAAVTTQFGILVDGQLDAPR
jgi:hypothetical protein